MKKIFLALVALFATMSMNAQTIVIYKNNVMIASYDNNATDTYKVVFKETPATPTTGTAEREGGISVNWVQLWAGGPKFAEYNVGAENNKPEDYGGYYCWGSSQNKVDNVQNNGTDVLSGETDTATKLWGENWRMPTSTELAGLLDAEKCTTTKTTINGVKGLLFTGKGNYAGNNIFLPAAGMSLFGYPRNQGEYGIYWSSTPNVGDSTYPYHLYTAQNNWEYSYVDCYHDTSSNGCFSVRAVLLEE